MACSTATGSHRIAVTIALFRSGPDHERSAGRRPPRPRTTSHAVHVPVTPTSSRYPTWLCTRNVPTTAAQSSAPRSPQETDQRSSRYRARNGKAMLGFQWCRNMYPPG
jgi:hypothetical protein